MADIIGTTGSDSATVTSGSDTSTTPYTYVDLGDGIDTLTVNYSAMTEAINMSASSLYVVMADGVVKRKDEV